MKEGREILKDGQRDGEEVQSEESGLSVRPTCPKTLLATYQNV